MRETTVSLNKISKTYDNLKILKNINLHLEKRKIYGLIGKNGAGKTTLMRLITGLAFPTGGTITLSTCNTGTLIESPALNPNMTATENLKFFRMLLLQKENGFSDEELLHLVGLSDTGKKKAKDFSLGMRQRLGIAVALLGNPEFLILDEPVNGLDPIGVIEIRNLVKTLNEKFHMTILISSHNLSELYQTATDYIIIDHGSVKKEISQIQLEQEHHGNLEEYFLSVIQS